MTIRWGVLGSGGIASRRTIPEGILNASNATLTAVYDINPQINQAAAQRFGAKPCATEDELLAQDCDALYIATPACLHCAQVIRAAQAGKHILCEKPLGMTVEEGERMLAACDQHHITLGAGFMMRFHAQHQAALAWINAGRIGKPVLGRAQLSCWYPPIPGAWRQDPATGGGGSLMDLGGHCIDLLEMFFGPVRSVYCRTARLVQDYPSEDTATTLLEFQNGAHGIVDTLFNVPDISSKNRLELYGSQGSILAEGTIGQGETGQMTAFLQEDAAGYAAQQARETNGGIAIAPEPVNMYRAEIETFSQALIDHQSPPVNAQHGLWSQRVIDACYRSAATGQTITL